MATRKTKQPKKTSTTGLVSVGDIGKMVGVESNTVSKWIQRHKNFPKPVGSPTAGNLYNKADVVKWLKSTGRA